MIIVMIMMNIMIIVIISREPCYIIRYDLVDYILLCITSYYIML